jgi:type VI secretion system VasD/TssJ family lipoprotein
VVCAVFLALAGCGNAVHVRLASDKDLNSSSTEAPLAVVVRVYVLGDDQAFKNADFRDLWKRDKEVLGSSMLATKEIVMTPGSEDKVELPYSEAAKYVAGIAIFRNPGTARWRFIDDISTNMVARYWHKMFAVSTSVRLTQNRIQLN